VFLLAGTTRRTPTSLPLRCRGAALSAEQFGQVSFEGMAVDASHRRRRLTQRDRRRRTDRLARPLTRSAGGGTGDGSTDAYERRRRALPHMPPCARATVGNLGAQFGLHLRSATRSISVT